MSYNFEDILLTNKEKLILFALRFHKKQEGNINAPPYKQLFRYDFISPNYYPERGPEGEDIPDDTFRSLIPIKDIEYIYVNNVYIDI